MNIPNNKKHPRYYNKSGEKQLGILKKLTMSMCVYIQLRFG
jgi:hypothetical protein